MSLSSKESLDAIANWAEWLSAIFGILAAISVIVLVFVNKPLKRIAEHEAQAERDKTAAFQSVAAQANERSLKLEAGNLALKTDLEKAKAEAAKAQLELRRYIDHVDRKAGPRRLDREQFLETLRGKPTGIALIQYKPEDAEAFQFATQICAMLKTAGWDAREPTTFPAGRGPRQTAVPSEFTYGGAFGSGVTIRCKNPRPEVREKSATGALVDAMLFAREGGGDLEVVGDPLLPENVFQIVIGQKK